MSTTNNSLEFVSEQVESLRTKWDSELFATIQKTITEEMKWCTDKIVAMKCVQERVENGIENRIERSNQTFDDFVTAYNADAVSIDTRYELYMAYMAVTFAADLHEVDK